MEFLDFFCENIIGNLLNEEPPISPFQILLFSSYLLYDSISVGVERREIQKYVPWSHTSFCVMQHPSTEQLIWVLQGHYKKKLTGIGRAIIDMIY